MWKIKQNINENEILNNWKIKQMGKWNKLENGTWN